MVADIAEAHLTPAAKRAVSRLLALEGSSHLDDISSWADDYRSQQKETGAWHYVNIPLDAPAFDPERDCKAGDCIVAKLAEYQKALHAKGSRPQVRLEALKWVVHLVGDIHQPLHVEDQDDEGGNKVKLTYFGKETNLHSLWDGQIIRHELGLNLGSNYSFDHAAVGLDAKHLDSMVAKGDRAKWAPGSLAVNMDKTATSWANEAHKLARTVAYGDLPQDRSGDWSSEYDSKAWPVIQGQLERAGVRLAKVLNESLR